MLEFSHRVILLSQAILIIDKVICNNLHNKFSLFRKIQFNNSNNQLIIKLNKTYLSLNNNPNLSNSHKLNNNNFKILLSLQ